MAGEKRNTLTVMLSVTGSMASYEQAGSYPRFVARLQAYAASFEAVHVCTFDTQDYTDRWGLSNALHHPMPRLAAVRLLYHLCAPLIHHRALRNTSVIRVFNITGAIPALMLRAFTRAPIFVSYGYPLPEFVRFQSGPLKYWLYRIVEEIALRGSDRIICATPVQNRRLGDQYGADKMLYVPNFVDVERFCPVDEPTNDHILFVGRLSAQKNLESLLRGLRLATDRGIAVRPLKVVGQGEREQALRRLAGELGVPAEFCGVVPNDRLPVWYAHAWCYVLPSHFEGMPKTLLEAMACAAPCIGSDVQGIHGLVADGVNGLLVEPTPEGVAQGLERLARDEGLRRHIAAEGRRYVVDHFSLDQILWQEVDALQRAAQ